MARLNPAWASSFVAKLDSRLAVISGVSKDPLVSTCMGELAHNFWPRFFYSLSFKNWSAPDQTANMRKRLAGVWTSATGVAADQITIAGNGRFANAAARQQYDLISSNEALVTTTAAFGNGTYKLQGNAITMIQDDRQNQTRNGLHPHGRRKQRRRPDLGAHPLPVAGQRSQRRRLRSALPQDQVKLHRSARSPGRH